jgi:hypothetical protein
LHFQPRRGDAKGEIVINISFMRLPRPRWPKHSHEPLLEAKKTANTRAAASIAFLLITFVYRGFMQR